MRVTRFTPGRRGRLVQLSGAADVLIVGDLHGHLDNFKQALRIANLGVNSRRHLVFQELIHGPFRYPGGGDKSHQLVDLVAALKVQYSDRVHFLSGNHELAQATSRRITKDSGVLNDLFRAGVVEAYGDMAEEFYRLYLEWFNVTPLALRTANRVLMTHSLPTAPRQLCFNPAILQQDAAPDPEYHPGGSIYDLVWGRDISEEAAGGFLKRMDADLLITGHVPCDRGFDFPNERQIILDSCSEPAGYCLFPADRPLTHADLAACISTL